MMLIFVHQHACMFEQYTFTWFSQSSYFYINQLLVVVQLKGWGIFWHFEILHPTRFVCVHSHFHLPNRNVAGIPYISNKVCQKAMEKCWFPKCPGSTEDNVTICNFWLTMNLSPLRGLMCQGVSSQTDTYEYHNTHSAHQKPSTSFFNLLHFGWMTTSPLLFLSNVSNK